MAYADVLQPYNFNGTLTQGIAGDTSVTGSFTIDFTKRTVPTFDITAPGDVFNSAVLPSSGELRTFTGVSPTGNFIETLFTSAASVLDLIFETSPPSRVIDFMTEDISVVPSGHIQSTYICTTITCSDSGFSTATFASGSATLVPVPPTVPEPTSLALLGTSLAGLAVLRRRKTNA
jgi:hypothetical protein